MTVRKGAPKRRAGERWRLREGEHVEVRAQARVWAHREHLAEPPLRVAPIDGGGLEVLDAALDRTILALNRDQANLSTDAELVVVHGATHISLATSQADASIIAEAIRRVVEKVRR